MIRRLKQTDFEALFALQKRAYQIEAELIGTTDFPPLRQTSAELMREAPLGYVLTSESRLIGCLTFSDRTITRLIVAPDFFRQGVASRLLRHALEAEDLQFVSTAKMNAPAIALYHQFNFIEDATTVRQDIVLAHLKRKTENNGADS
ncbi:MULTISPECIES: GNAT family N-acetyltransferase [unclassified Exiguobacterium]|uniref:GNAT family N-acetyltransferase n=1 Tax=unclassified Exiguobacterium TaxID=2644629 RepID=UPI001BEB45BD|nr:MULTISPECIES: GNAT family N-acetyltransferase [unclassified Exiguobacterium]